MLNNKPLFFVLLSIWLLPFASVKLLVFGYPLYPVEAVLLAGLPFVSLGRLRSAWDRPLVKSLALFSGVLLLGTLFSYGMHPSLAGLGQIKSFFIFPIILFLFVVTALRGENVPRALEQWRYVLLLSAAGAILFGLNDGFTYDHRLRAWFDSPNLLALFLLPGAVLWWSEAISPTRYRIGNWMAWCVVMAALFLTRSYGAVSAALIALAAFVWITRGYVPSASFWRQKLFLVPCILLLVFMSIEGGTDKWTMLASLHERSSLESRLMIWKSATRMIADQPIFGIGPGRFQEVYLAYQAYYPPYLEWAVPHPHNLWLAFWLSSGLLGLIAVIGLLGSVMILARPYAMGVKKPLFLAVLVSFFVAGFLDVPYFRAEFCYMLWLTLALLSIDSSSAADRNQNSIR